MDYLARPKTKKKVVRTITLPRDLEVELREIQAEMVLRSSHVSFSKVITILLQKSLQDRYSQHTLEKSPDIYFS